jgi:hypothetical protein
MLFMKMTMRLLAAVACGLGPFGPRPVDAWFGGNIVVILKEGRNLPQLDSYGPMGGDTDAYVKVCASDMSCRETDKT